jgi:hypothetical protein
MKPISSRHDGRHLDDAALAAIWTSAAAAGDSSVSPLNDSHLSACAECRVRYDAFVAWMEEIRSDARLEAEGAFTPERLAAQQAAILRRLEASERPARVLAFPRLSGSGAVRSVPVRRWIAAAAAAGLIVGVGIGQLMDLRHNPRLFPDTRIVQPPRTQATTVAAVSPASATASNTEDVLLLELEAAATPQYEALRAYDTLTPRAADFLVTSR